MAIELDAEGARVVADTGPALAGLPVVLPDAAAVAAMARLGAKAGMWLDAESPTVTPPEGTAFVLVRLPAAQSVTADIAAFRLKEVSTSLRAARPGIRIVVSPQGWAADALARGDLRPYVDGWLVEGRSPDERELVARHLPGIEIWARPSPGPASPFGRALAAAAFRSGGDVALLAVGRDAAVATVAALIRLRPLLPETLAPLPALSVACAPDCHLDALWQHPATAEAVAIASARRLESVRIAPPPREVVIESAAGAIVGTRDPTDNRTFRVPVLEGLALVRIRGWRDEESTFAEDVRVAAPASLSVEEIVARHQVADRRQRASIRRLISHGRTVLTFEAPGFVAPITVTAETTVFRGDGIEEAAQRAIRVNGVDLAGEGDVPRLPILEPERVSALPLTLLLDEAYRYRLDREETVDGARCYVVAFEPRDSAAALFRGEAWIRADTFALVRRKVVQTNLRGPIVAAEQHDDFMAVATDDGETVWLPSRTAMYQMYEGAGLRTPLHRVVVIDRHEVNPPDFAERRLAAHRSNAVILRDTPEGLRYLTRRTDDEAEGWRSPAPSRVERVRTLAFGVIVDPNITVPLPFAGLSYVDFDFLGRGAQLNAFFGGTYARAAWAVPDVGGSGWQLSGDAFAIAARYNDRAFVNGREIYAWNIEQRPMRATIGAARSIDNRVRVRADYEFDFVDYRAGADTAPSFVVPANAVVHGVRLTIEAQRGAWKGAAWWNAAHRQGWRPWGPNGTEPADREASFERFGASLGRAVVFSPTLSGRLDLAAVGGRDLDRFSRYSVGSFDNVIRGYPSASLRYDYGAIARSVLTWSPGTRMRLDGFADLAVVRDPAFGPRARGYPGVGAALEVPMPFGVLLAVEWGYGIKAPSNDGGRGTNVVRVVGYKVF